MRRSVYISRILLYPLDRNFGIPARLSIANNSPPANIWRCNHKIVGVVWEHYKITFVCLESILAKIMDCTGMGCQ